TTLYPASCRPLETSAPMPRVPPVTTATLVMSSSRSDGRAPFYASEFTPLRSAAKAASSALDAHGNSHAAADAERDQSPAGVAAPHLVQQRDQHPRSGGADRVADGDRAAVHVHPLAVEAEILRDGAGLGRERLVRLDQVDVVD